MLKRNENSFATVLSCVLLSFFLIPTYSQVPRDVEMDTIYGTIDDCLGLVEVRKDSSKLYKSKRILWERCVDSDHAVLKRVTTYFYNGKRQSISYYDENKNNYKEEIVTALGRKRSVMIKMNGVEIYKRETNQRTKKGRHIERYENGNIKVEGKLVEVKITNSELPGRYFVEDGVWKHYNEDGSLKSEVTYKKGIGGGRTTLFVGP